MQVGWFLIPVVFAVAGGRQTCIAFMATERKKKREKKRSAPSPSEISGPAEKGEGKSKVI